ncbi:hypothetical protein BH09PSE2_BH09PSE2_18670 [soil metagenome]
MMKILTLAGAALAIASAASAQPMRHDGMSQDHMNRGGMERGEGGMTHDFVSKAGASDKFEIGEARLAIARSRDPRVKRFATMMVRDHTQSTMKIKSAATRIMGHAPRPPVLDSEQQRMMDELRNARGRDFDRTYVSQQIPAHQQALELMNSYASNGDAPPLKRAAADIAPVVEHHLAMLNDMQGRLH